MKIYAGQVPVALVCMVLVYIIACQIGSMSKPIDPASTARVDELQVLLSKEKEKNADLLVELTQSQRTLEEYRTTVSNNSEQGKTMKEELDRAKILAGLSDVEGSGVVVTMTDSSTSSALLEGAIESYIVHDGDIREVVSELAGAGAEAVSINGQRIISTSGIRCVGPVVMVNDVKIAPPFEITAIGDSGTLEAAIMLKGGVADRLKNWGINITVKKLNKVKIEKYDGVLTYKYAKPIDNTTAQGGGN